MFIGECKLYIINISVPNDIENNKQYLTNINDFNEWESNSLILNIGETPNKFYAVNNSGKITLVNL
jgi:hypothetical protein